MAITSYGAKDQPQVASSGNTPDFAADLTSVSDFFAARSLRRFSTVAAILAATGMGTDDYAVATNAPGALFRYNGSGWDMHGVPRFADASARNTAIASPVSGMRCYRQDVDWTEQYFTTSDGVASNGWYPISGVLPSQLLARGGALNSTTSEATIQWDSATFGSISYASGVWTLPVSGRWRLVADVNFPSNGSTLGTTLRWKKNGTTIRRSGGCTNTVNESTVQCEIEGIFAAGDLLLCSVQSGGTLALVVGTTTMTALIEYVGPK